MSKFFQVFVGRFVPRKEREIELGEKAKKFTNVYIKNFNENLSEDDLTTMFSKYGKISSLKVGHLLWYIELIKTTYFTRDKLISG